MKYPLKSTLSVASNEPLSVAEVKLHCRIDHNEEDPLLQSYITAVREHVEEVTGRALVEKLVQYRFDDFNDVLGFEFRPLPFRNLSSFSYLDVNEIEQQVPTSIYRVITADRRAYITLRANQVWPSLLSDEDYPVQVTFVASPGTSSGSPSIPVLHPSLRAAMLLMIGDLYENRESQITGTIIARSETAMNLIRPFKLWS